MTPQAHTVLDIMTRDNGITHLTATHYNIGCVRKCVSIIRESGIKVKTVKRKDASGKVYTRWTLAKNYEQPMSYQMRLKLEQSNGLALAA